jgi:hypothetical protein
MDRWAQEADKLLGIRITPEVLWDLEPWSWLVDWFSNVGDVFTNITRFSHDGLVMKYGYVMARFDMTDEHTSYGTLWKDATMSTGMSTIVRGNTVKMRQHATPFGFGLSPSTDFTARQWAIIGALGLTRGDRVAW